MPVGICGFLLVRGRRLVLVSGSIVIDAHLRTFGAPLPLKIVDLLRHRFIVFRSN